MKIYSFTVGFLQNYIVIKVLTSNQKRLRGFMISILADRKSLPVRLTWSKFMLIMGNGISYQSVHSISVIVVPFQDEMMALRLLFKSMFICWDYKS